MIRQILGVLREGFEGPAEKVTYFLDSDAGLRSTLAKLSAADASRAVGGNSIAAHAHHLLFSFDAFGGFISGDRSSRDWSQSWAVNEVDDTAWTKLQADLAAGYQSLREAIKAHAESGDEALGGSLAAAAHLAYHVGAIRQKAAALRA